MLNAERSQKSGELIAKNSLIDSKRQIKFIFLKLPHDQRGVVESKSKNQTSDIENRYITFEVTLHFIHE